MATDGVKYSEFTPLPAGQLAGDENFVGLKNGVNVRLEGDWRGPMADLLRPSLMGTAPADIDANGYSNVSFLSTGGTGTVSADRNNAAFLGNDGQVTITLDAAAGRVEAQELMIGGELILFPQNNLTATANPGVNDDSSVGYSVLSKWINTSDGEVFVCVDATDGAAVWQQTTVDADDLGNLAFVNGSTVGVNLAQLSTPSAASWARVNSDGTVSLRTAAQTLSDLGGSGGSGDLTTGDIATPAEARAGTAGKILDAEGGHEMVKQWGLGVTGDLNYPLADIDADPTGVPDGFYQYTTGPNRPFGSPGLVHVQHVNPYSVILTFTVVFSSNAGVDLRVGKRGWVQGAWDQDWNANEFWTTANLQKVTSNSDTTAGSLTTVEWVQANAGGGGGDATGPYSIMPSIELSGDDQDGSNNIAVTLDLSEGTVWTIDCTNSPPMNTRGSINVTVTNLPAGSNTGISFQVYFKRAGRKGVNWTLPAGVTASWAGTQSYGSAASSVDVVQGYWLSTEPNIMHLSIIDKR